MAPLVPRPERIRGELRLAVVRLTISALGILETLWVLLRRLPSATDTADAQVGVGLVVLLYSLLVFAFLRQGNYSIAVPYFISALDVTAVTLILVLTHLSAAIAIYLVIIYTSILRHDGKNTLTVSAMALAAYGAVAAVNIFQGGVTTGGITETEVRTMAAKVLLIVVAGGSATYIAISYGRFLGHSIAAERKFLESDLRLKGISSSMPGILFQLRIGRTGAPTVTYMSESVSTLLGVEPDTLMSDPDAFQHLATPETYRVFLSRLQDRQVMSRPWSMEGELLVPSSMGGRERRWFRLLARPSKLSTGELLLDGIALDIHEAKQIEQELVEARNAAVRASETKSDFLANVSHEFRTPLNGIIGMADLLAESELNGDQRSALETIKRSSETLLTIINDILDLARVEAGNIAIERRPFSVSAVIYQITHLLVRECDDKGIDLITAVPASIQDLVVGDPGRLGQILFNLVGNAIKFTHEGYVKVEVHQRRTSLAQVALRIDVSDTGIGIEQETMDSIFDKFQQGSREVTRRYGGTGLGLAITRQMISLMGGSISVKSTPGSGSTFSVELPFEVSASEALRSTSPTPLAETHRTFIVHDDHRERGRSLVRLLRSAGLTVRTCARSRDLPTISDGVPIVAYSALCGLSDDDRNRLLADLGERAYFVAAGLQEQPRSRQQYPAARGYISFPIRTGELLEELQRGLSEGTASTNTREALRFTGRSSPDSNVPDVLVADDNEVNRTVMSRMLERLGYRVAAAIDGREAVARAETVAFRLIILDYLMPHMNGIEAAHAIRESRGPNRTTPILMLTGQGVVGLDAQGFQAAGVNRWMTKPIRLNELADVTAEYLGTDGPDRS